MAPHRMTANAESLAIKKPAWGRRMQQRPRRRVGVGIMIARNHRVAGAVTRTRLPQNAACRFPALRSSEVASQHGDSLQLRVREIQLWSQQRSPLLDLMKVFPPNRALPAAAAQHSAPIALHGPMDSLQCPEVPGNAVVRIVTAKHLVEVSNLLRDWLVPRSAIGAEC